MAAKCGMLASPDTLLRLIRQAPEVERPAPTRLGVDDWAIHKGLTYGTILVDLERHRPVDLLPDRSSTSLAAWLRAHPGVQLIARDRTGADAEGARDGAPDAVQVADRWHLVDHLADALAACFRSKGSCLTAATAAGPSFAPDTCSMSAAVAADETDQGKRRYPQPERWRDRMEAAAEAGVARRRARDEQVRALHANGACVAHIAREVGIARMTVYKYLRQGPPQRTRHSLHGKQRVLEPWEPYLLRVKSRGISLAARAR